MAIVWIATALALSTPSALSQTLKLSKLYNPE